MTLFEQVSKDIVAAMKAKDKVRLEALRNIKKVFLEAKTAPGANDTLEDADAMKILQKLAKQGHDSAELYAWQGRQDLADAELAQRMGHLTAGQAVATQYDWDTTVEKLAAVVCASRL